MTKKEKIKEKFLNNPKSLSFSKILNFLLFEGYEYIDAKGSHNKVIYIPNKKHISVPVHNNEIKEYYKKKLKEFYISNLKSYES